MPQITDVILKAKTAENAGERLSDGGNLYGNVRTDRKGNIVVGFEYRFRSPVTGKTRAIGCGIWPAVSLKAIRLTRDKHRLAVDQGSDPLDAKKADKLAMQAAQAEAIQAEQLRLERVAELGARLNVRNLFDKWEKTELASRKDKGAEVRRMFEKDVFPIIGEMAAEDVRKGHVMALVDKVKERGVSRMARVIFSHVRQMMRFAVDRDLIESDPTAAIRKEKAVGKDAERDRVLAESEIKQLAKALPDSGVPKQTALAVSLMLSTLCRVGELIKAKWSDIDLENNQWRIPADVAKNEKEHIVFLSQFAANKFNELKALNLSDVWAYPSREGQPRKTTKARHDQVTSDLTDEKKPTHLNEKAITKQLRDRQRTEPLKGRAKGEKMNALLLPGGQWTSHDLRRTGATMMGELGVDGDTIERCLNHKEQNKMKRTYQRQRNEQAMIDAWNVLGTRLALLMNAGADNVVTIESVTRAKTAA